jgi:hypothetical protein
MGSAYLDRQSRLLFAIGAALVILGSTATSAVQPQTISEGAKSCKAISNDQRRLKCFDDLFADQPGPQPTTIEQSKQDNWQIEESKSPTLGTPQVNAANLVGDTVLILRCKDQMTEAAFSTKYSWLGSRSVDVTLRINDAKPVKAVWKASIDGRAAFAPDAVGFIRMLPDNSKLFIKTSRSDGKTKEASYDLGQVSDIRNKIAHACDWDDMPSDNPVGSVDQLNPPH